MLGTLEAMNSTFWFFGNLYVSIFSLLLLPAPTASIGRPTVAAEAPEEGVTGGVETVAVDVPEAIDGAVDDDWDGVDCCAGLVGASGFRVRMGLICLPTLPTAFFIAVPHWLE
jgi:hypothetical protein